MFRSNFFPSTVRVVMHVVVHSIPACMHALQCSSAVLTSSVWEDRDRGSRYINFGSANRVGNIALFIEQRIEQQCMRRCADASSELAARENLQLQRLIIESVEVSRNFTCTATKVRALIMTRLSLIMSRLRIPGIREY